MRKIVRTYYAFILVSIGLLIATSAQACTRDVVANDAWYQNIDLDELVSIFNSTFTKEGFQLTAQKKDPGETTLLLDFQEEGQNVVTGVIKNQARQSIWRYKVLDIDYMGFD